MMIEIVASSWLLQCLELHQLGRQLTDQSRMFDDLDMDDEENNNSAGTMNEESERILSDAVSRTVNDVERLSWAEKGQDKADEGKDLIGENLSEGGEVFQTAMSTKQLIESRLCL